MLKNEKKRGGDEAREQGDLFIVKIIINIHIRSARRERRNQWHKTIVGRETRVAWRSLAENGKIIRMKIFESDFGSEAESRLT